MKLAECIQHINQVLNYPSFAYSDMSYFLDQAIAELNTTLRIDIPIVSKMIDLSRIPYLESPDTVLLQSVPSTTIPTGTAYSGDAYWYNTTDGNFYIGTSEVPHKTLYGVYMPDMASRSVYQAIAYSNSMVIWIELDVNALPDVDLSKWLPDEWVILFVIPYVCSKCSARDGGNSTLYVEEYTQGFQQLQTSYRVPNHISFVDASFLPAYEADVKEVLELGGDTNQMFRTKAIYPFMKINTMESAVFGGMYENGGWGL